MSHAGDHRPRRPVRQAQPGHHAAARSSGRSTRTCRISLETKTLDAFAADVIERTGYKAMLEADAAKGHEDAADRLQNLGQLVNNVKNYCDQHGEEATLEGLSGRYRPHQRHRQLQRERRPGGADDHPFGQGAGVPLCVPHRYGRGRVPQRDEPSIPRRTWKKSAALPTSAITRAKKELYHLQQRHPDALRPHPAQRAQPLFARDRAGVHAKRPAARCWNSVPVWAAGAAATATPCPAAQSGYSGPSGWGRSAGGYGSGGYGSRSGGGYLNREYNAGERSGFGSGYAGRGTSSSGYGAAYGNSSTQPKVRSGGFGAGYSGTGAKTPAAKISFTGAPAAKAASAGPKHYEPGDIVEHKVFGRGTVLKVKPAAGDQIVEIQL